MLKTKTITFRADEKTHSLLNRYSKSSKQNKSSLLTNAINSYIEYELWQERQIDNSLVEIERGEVIPWARVKADLLKKLA